MAKPVKDVDGNDIQTLADTVIYLAEERVCKRQAMYLTGAIHAITMELSLKLAEEIVSKDKERSNGKHEKD